MSHVLVGLDCETSGRQIREGARLIQAGLCVRDRGSGTLQVFSSLVFPGTGFVWEDQSAAIHKLSYADVLAADTAEHVDHNAQQWLRQHCPPVELVAVGLNVGSFDFAFFHETLPATISMFTHRSVDLNSIFYTLDGKPGPDGTTWSWTQWKSVAAEYATQQLADMPSCAHDAGWDAAAAVVMHEWLVKHIHTSTNPPY